MKSVTRTIAAAALAAAVMAPLAGGIAASAAPQGAPAKVSYAPIAAGTYAIDPAHSVIGFSIRHFELSWVQGRFKDFKGAITYDDKDPSKSSVEFTASVQSIDTGVAPRDNHLRTADFFEAEKFPELSFKSTKIERRGDGYVATGDLTIKGVTKQVSLPFSVSGAVVDPHGNAKIGVEASTKINRLDFGVGAPAPMKTGGLAIGSEVTIEISLEAAKAAPQS